MAGTKDAVLMVESEANGLSEEEMLNAVKFGHEGFVPIIAMIEDLAKQLTESAQNNVSEDIIEESLENITETLDETPEEDE